MPTDRPTLFAASAILCHPDEPLLINGGVLVAGGTVVEVGSRDEFGVAPDADVVDVGDGLLAPGLIDPHVHLGFDGSDLPSATMRSADDVELAWLLARNAARQLHSGVTACRDLGCRDTFASRLRDAITNATLVGPRVIAADAPVTVTGGHCWYMAEECDAEFDLIRAVRKRARDGADVVKVMLTGGFLYSQGDAPHRSVYSAEELAAAVADAHRVGLQVAVHAHGSEGVRVAAAAGVDTIEHATMTTPDGPVFDSLLADAIAESGAIVVPTLSARWTDDDLPWASAAAAFEVIAGMHGAGVRIAIGSDAGIDGVPHGRYHEAVAALSAAGLGNRDVYRSATIHAASACSLDGRAGIVRPGAFADFVLLDTDPRDDLRTLGHVRSVIARGSVVDPRDRSVNE